MKEVLLESFLWNLFLKVFKGFFFFSFYSPLGSLYFLESLSLKELQQYLVQVWVSCIFLSSLLPGIPTWIISSVVCYTTTEDVLYHICTNVHMVGKQQTRWWWITGNIKPRRRLGGWDLKAMERCCTLSAMGWRKCHEGFVSGRVGSVSVQRSVWTN